jgi:ABC-type sugar transport system ATPase subunit
MMLKWEYHQMQRESSASIRTRSTIKAINKRKCSKSLSTGDQQKISQLLE